MNEYRFPRVSWKNVDRKLLDFQKLKRNNLLKLRIEKCPIKTNLLVLTKKSKRILFAWIHADSNPYWFDPIGMTRKNGLSSWMDLFKIEIISTLNSQIQCSCHELTVWCILNTFIPIELKISIAGSSFGISYKSMGSVFNFDQYK